MSVDRTFNTSAISYIACLSNSFTGEILGNVELLANLLLDAWKSKKQVFICGNGGSAANAIHMANDFHYGIGACGKGEKMVGLRVEALSSNVGVLTCLGNDTGYENIYSGQIEVKADEGDLLIVLSGSGNSMNVVNAIETARMKGLTTVCIVAFDGGKCVELADVRIHFPIDDMQIAEDTQLIVGHLCMQWLSKNKPYPSEERKDGRD